MRRILLTGAALAIMAAVMPRPVSAEAYDGAWHVTIITEKGDCDRAYGYALAVNRGRISYSGEASINLSGTVSGSGAVRVSISKGSQYADGTGRLRGGSGAGTWRGKSSTGGCAGRWEAERR